MIRLNRRSRAVLAPDSTDDHEFLYEYALPGIVMYARRALLRYDRGWRDGSPVVRARGSRYCRECHAAAHLGDSRRCRVSPRGELRWVGPTAHLARPFLAWWWDYGQWV